MTPLTIDRLLSDLKKRRLKWELVGQHRWLRTEGILCPLMAWAGVTWVNAAKHFAHMEGMPYKDIWRIIDAADCEHGYNHSLRRRMLRALRTK